MKTHLTRLILVLVGLSTLPSQAAKDNSEDLHPKTLRVITYNTWYVFNKKSELQAGKMWINEQAPDIVALQELTNIQPELLQSMANSWGHKHSSLLKTSGFSTGLTSRYPITVVEKGLEGMHHGYLHVRTAGIEIFVVHLSPFKHTKRQEEANRLLEKITPLLDAKKKVMVLGDFNALSAYDARILDQNNAALESTRANDLEHDHCQNLKEGQFEYGVMQTFFDAGLVDSAKDHLPETRQERMTIPSGVWTDKKTAPKLGKRIDYILTGPQLHKMIKSISIKREGALNRISDHYPVMVDFSLSTGPLVSAPQPAVIPQPVSMEMMTGHLILQGSIAYRCPSKFSRALQFGLSRLTAHSTITLDQGESPTIIINEDESLKSNEAYAIRIADRQIHIKAKHEAGVFYATQTLLQLIQEDVFDASLRVDSVTLPNLEIRDTPRFGWRGLMLDSSRHFQTVAEVKRFIDLMSIHKLNVFHWHLTDGHGWRFESKKYPKLTQKGAWRMQPGFPEAGKTGRYGGFYTQEEMKDVIAYAKQRHITVIPEVDMPGHCFSMVAAYPALGCLGHPQEVAHLYTYPADAQRFPKLTGTDVLCVGKEETIQVCKDILDEVIELFPSRFIHIGGDEVNKSHWKSCDHCKAHRKKLNLKDEHELQSWFIQQLDNHITQQGRRLIGWDEILEGGLAKNATVMSWRGEQGGIRAAKMGHDVVMSPQTYIYLDHGQSHSPLEPAHWPGHKPLSRVYSYNPTPAKLTAEEARHILGVQGNVWTAFVHEEWLVDLQTWPRAAAIAEIGWSPQVTRDWEHFMQRLVNTHRRRLDHLGVNYWWEHTVQLGSWSPARLKAEEEIVGLEFNITPALLNFTGGTLDIAFNYSGGKHGLSILAVTLLEDGRELHTDRHKGFTGVKNVKNIYNLGEVNPRDGSKYELKVSAYGNGGGDSNGTINWSAVETKRIK